MPKSAPTKVSISPKAIKTELSITPIGGTINPAINKAQPTTISSIAESSWIVSFLLSSFIAKSVSFGKSVLHTTFAVMIVDLCSQSVYESVRRLALGELGCALAHPKTFLWLDESGVRCVVIVEKCNLECCEVGCHVAWFYHFPRTA